MTLCFCGTQNTTLRRSRQCTKMFIKNPKWSAKMPQLKTFAGHIIASDLDQVSLARRPNVPHPNDQEEKYFVCYQCPEIRVISDLRENSDVPTCILMSRNANGSNIFCGEREQNVPTFIFNHDCDLRPVARRKLAGHCSRLFIALRPLSCLTVIYMHLFQRGQSHC